MELGFVIEPIEDSSSFPVSEKLEVDYCHSVALRAKIPLDKHISSLVITKKARHNSDCFNRGRHCVSKAQ